MRRVMLHHQHLGIRELRPHSQQRSLPERPDQRDAVYLCCSQSGHLKRARNRGLRQLASRRLARYFAFLHGRQ